MTYRQRLSFFICIDSCIVLSAIFISSFLVGEPIHVENTLLWISTIAILCSHYFFSLSYKLYKKVWEYASTNELLLLLKIVTYVAFVTGVVQFIALQEIRFKFLMITWLLHLFFIGGSRLVWRLYRDSIINRRTTKVRTLIVGAGSAGTMVARQLLKNSECRLLPIGFIDDNSKKKNLDILGLPVIGGVREIVDVVEERKVDNIIIAIPSLPEKELKPIIQECAKTKAETKILPLLEDLITGKVSVNQFRDVEVEDLLGREPIDIDIESISKNIQGKRVLVTGAGGSIGSELSRQLIEFQPSHLILLGHGENSIYTIEMELKEKKQHDAVEITAIIADIQDKDKMMDVIKTHKPDIIYHAAAHKHVPLMEKNPEEAVKNNMIGTMNIAIAASVHQVTTFVMVSTDKAVHPTSVMGASKKLAEMIIQDMDRKSDTKFVAVRFGNVLGSRGSVIPLFKKQIERGGPVTVTHPDMVRYFMTIPEASRLVIQAGALANGGEIFVLDMGEPIKIVDLAKNLITLSGFTLDDIEITYTGARPGEKLFEELLTEQEIVDQQIYPKIYIGKTTEIQIESIQDILATYTSLDSHALKNRLIEIANSKTIHKSESVVTI
ncbi:SDR family NAD(P)-dependent oxidoreductase [Agaribacter marinus]|uniref:Polysaccharide biosynthesis protein n=1 Tax=Virgibacillus salarius TaxID=447199 RepID=A0A941ICZ2_9BACI|nr:nucleoside-diphosphate sugar epimerase/dehydratase [uncultured Virgibacillus sp.]MBR7796650.1 polysaccharide biosynthesis protein [Virgibacillus salarius]NAZ09360.1 SDR family NAD(P)-dependent oxidoreductase [Agaribacter marinus]